MMNWVIIIGAGAGVSTVIGTALFLVLNLLRFNSNFTELRVEVKNLGKRMDETKTEMGKRDAKIDKKFDEVKEDIKEMKTDIEKRDAKIDKKFDEVKEDIKDLRMEITGRKIIESFDGIKTDIKYIKEGFAKSEQRNKKKTRTKGKARKSTAKEKAKTKQSRAARMLISNTGLESLGEPVKRKSGQKNIAIA